MYRRRLGIRSSFLRSNIWILVHAYTIQVLDTQFQARNKAWGEAVTSHYLLRFVYWVRYATEGEACRPCLFFSNIRDLQEHIGCSGVAVAGLADASWVDYHSYLFAVAILLIRGNVERHRLAGFRDIGFHYAFNLLEDERHMCVPDKTIPGVEERKALGSIEYIEEVFPHGITRRRMYQCNGGPVSR